MATGRGGAKESRLFWFYLAIVALLTFVGHQVGTELWNREWEATDQSGDPELGSLYSFLGLVGGFTLAIVLTFTHITWRGRNDRTNR